MDTPAVNRLFRRLATHHFCHSAQLTRATTQLPGRIVEGTRANSTKRPTPETTGGKAWQQRTEHFAADKAEEYRRYPVVTSDSLRARHERPRRVKMLMRDFIEDSLYNPQYGYFSKNVTIFHPGAPFEFNKIKNEPEFQKILGQRYTEFEDKMDAVEFNELRQLWHTPTELFRPHYAEAIARYMVANYKLALYPYHDLVIYEMGAGNGTLMLDILDYIRNTDPEVYARTKFRIIEVSEALAGLQMAKLRGDAASREHVNKVEIVNKSIFDWDLYVPTPCFFLAMEVFDNFAHDVIRYDPETKMPLQGSVLIDNDGEFYEFYSRQLDPVAAHYLKFRETACQERTYSTPVRSRSIMESLKQKWASGHNLTPPEYIPTRLMQFFYILSTKFPAHRLITTDFHKLPQATKGYNAPVVQTRYQRQTVLVRTPLVKQGYFDILFPTDFNVMEDMYRAITGRLTRVMTHEEFFKRWAYVEDMQMRSGENALLGWYQNQSVMLTV